MSLEEVEIRVEDQPLAIDAVDVVRLPWVFTQTHPLSSREFCKEAERRGIKIDTPTLRELYRLHLLAPLVRVRDRKVEDGRGPIESFSEPLARGTWLTELRLARKEGRVVDPGTQPFPARLRLEGRQGDSSHWWNGLLYSTYQLLAAREFRRRIEQRQYVGTWERPIAQLGHLTPWEMAAARRLREIAVVLTPLEARYLPKLDPESIHLTNADFDEWDSYRQSFDPVAMSGQLGYPPERALGDAEWLLSRAHAFDPMGDWSNLIRRAPRRFWKSLSGDALAAMDYRVAAELLLLFYEDLVAHDAALPLDPLTPRFWHPRLERLSHHRRTLDDTLGSLGVSPHPSVVLVVEGETEEFIVPRVWERLDVRPEPDLLRVITRRGDSSDLTKLAAFAAAPLVGERQHDDLRRLIKPPTRLVILVDPEPDHSTPKQVEDERQKILKEILRVAKSQGAEPDPEDIDALVQIHTWEEPCFEFAHFSVQELAQALRRMHPNCNGMSDAQLEQALASIRTKRRDIKGLWENIWRPGVSKTRLANALWPVLDAKIAAAMADPNKGWPSIAERLIEAHMLARSRPAGSFVIRDLSGRPEPEPP